MAEFEIIKNGRTLRKVSWSDDAMVIGRDVLTELCLPDELVSRRHARVFVEKGILMLEDLQTKNGTFVNGRREYKRALKNADRIEFGMFTVLVHVGPRERFVDTPLQGEALEDDDSDLIEGAFMVGDANDGPATKVVGPAQLARMRQEHDIKMNPHLVLALGAKTAFFPLKYQTTFIGSAESCQVRIIAMKREKAVTLEAKEDGTYEVKKLGLCVKLKVGKDKQKVKAAVLGDSHTFEVEGQEFTLRLPGMAKKAAAPRQDEHAEG